jgi:hypothetical protein
VTTANERSSRRSRPSGASRAACSSAWTFALSSVVVASAIGCGNREMGRVSGILTYEGKPVPDAVVKFTARSRPTAVGRTDAAGRYTLTTFRKGDGAYGGSHRIVVIPWMEAWIELADDAQTGRKPPPVLPRPDIPEKYRGLETTPLKAEVVAGRENAFPLEMEE